MAARLLVILLLGAALAAPAAAPAQDPFDPVAPQAPPQQPAPAPVPVQEDEEGLSRWQELLIGGAGLVLLLGIGWAIVRDARHAAPVEDRRGAPEAAGRARGSRRPKARRVQSGRAKAKAARRARKRNR
jgi:hypothetical protein